MREVQAGNAAVWEQLLAELAGIIELYLRARFGSLDVLEDLVQEALIALHEARHTWNPSRAFRPWMFTVVRHRSIDLLRQRGSRLRTAESARREVTRHAGEDPEHLLRLLDGIRLLDALKPDHREAVTLTKYAGMTTAEAASWLGISETALKARLNRGLRAIRQHLDAEEIPA